MRKKVPSSKKSTEKRVRAFIQKITFLQWINSLLFTCVTKCYYSFQVGMAPSYHSECGNLEHWLPGSIFETRRPYFGGVFATINSRIAVKNIGDWGRYLGSHYFRDCPQSPIFFAAIRDLVIAKAPPKWRRRISKIELGGSC